MEPDVTRDSVNQKLSVPRAKSSLVNLTPSTVKSVGSTRVADRDTRNEILI